MRIVIDKVVNPLKLCFDHHSPELLVTVIWPFLNVTYNNQHIKTKS